MKFTLIFNQKTLPNFKNQTEFNLHLCCYVAQNVPL